MQAISLRIENRASIDRMSDADAGALLKALLAHADGEEVKADELPVTAGILYPLIAGQIDRSFEQYEEVRQKRIQSAQKRWSKEQSEAMQTDANACKRMQTDASAGNPNPNPIIKKDIPSVYRKKVFSPPTVDEVATYVSEKGYKVDAERFVDFYQSKNWFVGKNKMVDWKAAVRNWAREHKDEPKRNPKIQSAYGFSTERNTVDYNALAMQRAWQEG